jgi:lambda family phage tail tape measure protein
MANMIARLGVVLGLDSAEFSKGLEAAGKKLEQFGQAAEKFGRIGATALAAASVAAIKYADELADVAEANEVAIGTVLQLSNALANSGGQADNAGKMLSAFSKFIDEAASGSDKAQKTAAALGVTLKDLGKLSQEELLNKLVVNLSQIEDPITRNAKAMEIFSKAAKGVDMVAFAEQMSKANPLIQEQEKAIKDAAETYDLLAQSSRDVMLTLATQLGPVLKASIDYIKDLAGETNLLGPVFKTVFQTIAVSIADVAFVLGGLLRQMQLTITIFKSVIPSYDDSEFENVFGKKEIADIIARQNLDRFVNQVMGVSEYGNSIDALAKKGAATTPAASGGRKVSESKEAEAARKRQMQLYAQGAANAQKAAEEDAKARAEFFAMYEKGNLAVSERQRMMSIALDNEKEMMQLEMKSHGMRQEAFALEREQLQIRQKLAANLEELDNRRDLTATARAEAEAREVALAEKALSIAQQRYQLTLQLRQGSYEEGFTKQAIRFLRDMPTELEQGAKAFDSLMGNMESAIERFVRTGKLGFKDLAKSIIQDMLAMQMKAAASGFLSSLFGSMFGMKSNPYQPAAVMGFPGYANGGSPAVNSPSIVGERGPEIFVPRTAGTIIPNHALNSMGGTTNVTNNYINAIDTKSFEERLYGSSNAIWAANQYANKSLAVNRGRA